MVVQHLVDVCKVRHFHVAAALIFGTQRIAHEVVFDLMCQLEDKCSQTPFSGCAAKTLNGLLGHIKYVCSASSPFPHMHVLNMCVLQPQQAHSPHKPIIGDVCNQSLPQKCFFFANEGNLGCCIRRCNFDQRHLLNPNATPSR